MYLEYPILVMQTEIGQNLADLFYKNERKKGRILSYIDSL